MASWLPWQAEAAIIFEINYYGWLVGGTIQQPQPITNSVAVPIKSAGLRTRICGLVVSDVSPWPFP